MNRDRNGDIVWNLLKPAIPRKHFVFLSSNVRLQRHDAWPPTTCHTKKRI